MTDQLARRRHDRPRRKRARVRNARRHAAERSDRAAHLLQVPHRRRHHLQDEAVVARDMVRLDHLGRLRQQVVQRRVDAARVAQPQERQDRSSRAVPGRRPRDSRRSLPPLRADAPARRPRCSTCAPSGPARRSTAGRRAAARRGGRRRRIGADCGIARPCRDSSTKSAALAAERRRMSLQFGPPAP